MPNYPSVQTFINEALTAAYKEGHAAASEELAQRLCEARKQSYADGYRAAYAQVEARKRADIWYQPGVRHEEWCDDQTCPAQRRNCKNT